MIIMFLDINVNFFLFYIPTWTTLGGWFCVLGDFNERENASECFEQVE